jgi:type I restriction enzyme S subunit
MSLKILTISSSEIKKDLRIEARVYYNKSLLKKTFQSIGFLEINDFATLKSGKTPKHYDEKLNESFIYFIKSADIKRFNINLTTVSYITKEIHKSQISSKVISGDVLLSNTGKYLGFASKVFKNIKEANINQNIIRIRFKKDYSSYFNENFLVGFLNSKFGQIEIESMLTLTGQKYLNMQKFKKFKIPKVDKKLINSVSKKLENAENKEIEALNLIHQAQQLFYQKLGINFSKIRKENFYSVNLSDFMDVDLWTPKYSYPFYVNTLKAIKQKWQTVSIGKIATVKRGDEVGSENYNSYLDKKDSDVPFIRTSDLVNYEVDQFPDFYIPREIYEELNQDIQAGDVLFTKDGKIGMTAMITESDKVIIASGLSRLRLKKEAKEYNLTPEYLFLVLSLKETGLYPALRRTVTASTIPHLREERLKEIEIPILDKNSINEITKHVKEAFKLKDEKKKLIQEVREEIDKYFEV